MAGCSVGPKYVRPSAVPQAAKIPPIYQETPPPPAGWLPVQPAENQLRGKWWTIFKDEELNKVEDQVDVNNQNLAQAEANYRSALDQAKVARSYLFPTINAGPQALREKESQHRPFVNSTPVAGQPVPEFTENDFVLSGGFNYEVDAWGRIRHQVAEAREQAQASAADLATINLSVHSQLALDYFQMRGLDSQAALLDSTVKAYERSLELTLNRFHGGVATELDVAQARTQLETTRNALIDVGIQRAALEHAIATLIGQTASTVTIAPAVFVNPPPIVPPGMPSQLVERRPDVAAQERLVAAANENIGIQRAAYFPTITLIANGGFESTRLGNLIQGPSSLWSFGATAIETIFDAGRRHALNDQARAQYDAEVALYRQTTLTAFQQVEDNLAAVRILQQEQTVEESAVAASQRYLELAVNRYKGGLGTYLDVITAQAAVLTAQRTATDVMTRHYMSTVNLVMALGGGWERAQDLPKL